MATGARRAEICGLRWSDVDFEAGTLSISRSHSVAPGVRGDRPTKTRSTRLVTLDPVTLDGLRSALVRSVSLATDVGDAADKRRADVFTDDPTGANRVASRHCTLSMGQSRIRKCQAALTWKDASYIPC